VLDRQRQRIERSPVRGELRQQRDAVRECDIAPHFRRAAGDTREIAEATACVAEVLGAVLARRELGHER
jgi:hypothetical protein